MRCRCLHMVRLDQDHQQSERAGISLGDAFALLRAQARRTQQTLTATAYAVLEGTIGVNDMLAR
jgi:hypothetical protein